MAVGREFWKTSIVRSSKAFTLPDIWVRRSFSCRLNAARSMAISAALAADFSISLKELRHGWFNSVLLSSSEVWPRMLVRALLKSSATERANCSAQSSFCLCAVLASGEAAAAGAGGAASGLGITGRAITGTGADSLTGGSGAGEVSLKSCRTK